MKQRVDKLRKLIRFREFQESLAADSVRQAFEEANQAARAHEQAEALVDEAGSWKLRALAGGDVDIGLYGFALANEQEAVERCAEAETVREDSRRRTLEAQERWRSAASATRVSRERELAGARAVGEIEEKRMFDQLGELLLARRGDVGGRHD